MKSKYSCFTKHNFIIIAIAMLCIAIGFVLMLGSSTQLEFNPDVFSFRRVTLAPVVVMSGFVLMIVGILYKKR